MAQSKGKVIGSRNDVAVPKMKGTLLRKNGFYFITNTYARAGPVLVWGKGNSTTQQLNSIDSLESRPTLNEPCAYY